MRKKEKDIANESSNGDGATIKLNHPLFLFSKDGEAGSVSQLALNQDDREFDVIEAEENCYTLKHQSGSIFKASLKKVTGKNKGTYRVEGCAQLHSGSSTNFLESVDIGSEGPAGLKLRPAQIGAVHALLSHWSLSHEVATVVLPTGTGKTETMLVTTLADRAKRTLVIVPTLDLKDQISEKFATWGMLRELGVIPQDAANPKVLTVGKTIGDKNDLGLIENADVVISTPALLARSTSEIRKRLRALFSHVYFDEAHHIQAKEWSDLRSLFSDSKVVQFTATPYRNDRKPIEGEIVYDYPVSKALEDDCFSKISLVSVSERHPKRKDKAIADAAIGRLHQDRKKGWTEHRVMVRAEDTPKAEDLYKKYLEWFPEERIVLVHSNVKGRKSIVQDIRNGLYDIIVCVDMLKEGFDYPEFKIAAVHGVHKSLAVLLQFIGRFTRTRDGLGDASFVVNHAEEKMSAELENVFQEGSGWEEVISEIADAKKASAASLLAFLQGCKPYLGFDTPDVDLNPKLVYPALSCVCFKATEVDWGKFKDAFNLKYYALSRPYLNTEENVFYFCTQKREKVKWARTSKMRDQSWNLIVMHHDPDTNILYVGFSEKRLDVALLVEKVTGKKPKIMAGDQVFRSFDSIKRLSIVHAGIFKPANHLHRYSRLSGADVTTELTKWKEGKRCQKSDFVGVGFRGGFPVGIGASVKGKVWSPARAGDLQEWKAWCLEIGRLLSDETIDSNQLLEDSAERIQLESFPEELVVLATDWSEQLYGRIHKVTIERKGSPSYLLGECALKFVHSKGTRAFFELHLFEEEVSFSMVLGGEQGFTIHGLEKSDLLIDGLRSNSIPVQKFFEEYPPTLFLLNGCTISGCIHTNYGEVFETQIPGAQVKKLEWKDVNFKHESMYKSAKKRNNSIQEFVMQKLVDRGARVVFNDDNSGESADVVAIFWDGDLVRFELVHCKYSKEKAGSRISDLYEVCGQAIVSLRYKWRPEELLRHMERRNGAGVLKGKRFFYGDGADIEEVRGALKYSEVEFEFAVAQPGVESASMTIDMKNFLGSVYSTVVEMTETKLKCYFS
jgi:superfamily II DNA or RNA helicase